MTQATKRQVACLLVFAIVMSFFPSVNSSAATVTTSHFSNNPIEDYQSQRGQSDLRLWYDKPTTVSKPGEENFNRDDWQMRSLPIGNGKMGAMLAGQVINEIIQYNEESLWDGGPSKSRPNYNGGNISGKHELLKEVQQLMLNGNLSQGSSKASGLVGSSAGYGGYQNFGWIELTHKFDGQPFDQSELTNYARDLDLNTATASTSFVYKDVGYIREYFMSYPKNVMVVRQTATQSGKLNLDISASSAHNGTITISDNIIKTSGSLSDNQLRYESQVKVLHTGGNMQPLADKISITDADEIILIMTAATDYKNEYPHYRSGIDPAQVVTETLALVDNLSFDELFAEHYEDYSNIFHRVSLDLNGSQSGKTTDVLLREYKQNKRAKELEILLFQYGRYLNISSSRIGSLPSNLQGVWNHSNNPPWSSDYHINVNLQMNYWPVYVTNMAETALPLVDFIESWRKPGRVTAAEYMGIVSDESNPENGFTANTQNTPYGWTCPGWSFDWGWSPAAVPWMLQNIWEYYEFTGDLVYMRDAIYPIMREQAVFWQQYLVLNPKDNMYYSAPAYSPEHGPRTLGNVYEHVLVKQLLLDTITASEQLGVDGDLRTEWQYIADHIRTEEIGTDGQLKEWFDETSLGSMGGQSNHRHLSHMLGVYPGDSVSIKTPELLEATRVSLNRRGDASTGWGMGQRINTWARVQDGERAYQLIDYLFKNGIYENLFDTHPPFQIDGNFGYTSGVAEMLLQSNLGFIQPLPAIPNAWSKGQVSGLVARGNFEIDMKWSSKTLDAMTIRSNNGGMATVYYPGIATKVEINKNGSVIPFETIDADTIQWDTQAGDVFNLEIFGFNKGVSVEALEIRSVTGATVIGSPNGSMQMTANISPFDADIKDIEWSVSDTSLATIDQDGVLRAGRKSGTVNVSASAKDGSGISDSIDITLSLGDTLKETIVDNKDLPSSSFNGAWSEWPDNKHYGGSIHYIQGKENVGKSIIYNFVGTGIEAYAPLNATFGSYEVYIDDEYKTTVELYNNTVPTQGTPQVLIYSTSNLELGDHTIELRLVGRDGKYKAEFDYFKVLEERNLNSVKVDNNNPRLGYSGNWKEYSHPKHYGGSIHYIPNAPESVGSSISYGFSGTGVEIYTPLNETFGALDIVIDDEEMETVDLYRSGIPAEGLAQQKIFSIQDLSPGSHSIELIVAERDGKSKVEFDYLEIFSNITSLNLTPLQQMLERVEAAIFNSEYSYTPETFLAFENALENAVQFINHSGDGDSIVEIVNQLEMALDGLEKNTVDKGALKGIILNASALNRWNYTQASWQTLVQAIADGEVILRNLGATQEAVTQSVDTIQTTMDNLIPVQPDVVNKSSLVALVNLIDKLQQSDYIPETWDNLLKPLQHAQDVIHDSKATAAQVKEAEKMLQEAIDSLVLKEPDPSADTSKLRALIAQAEKYKGVDFTQESWANFNEALVHAKQLVEKENSTQAQIDAAIILLQSGMNGLVRAINPKPPLKIPSTTRKSTSTNVPNKILPRTISPNVLLKNAQYLKNEDNTILRLNNIDYIATDSLAVLAKQIRNDNKKIKLYLDQKSDNKIISRIYFDPTKFIDLPKNTNIVLGIEYDTLRVQDIAKKISSQYKTPLIAVQHKHIGSFGTELRIAIKPDLKNLNTNQLSVYWLNEKTGELLAIPNANPRMDSNGYLHYSTDKGGTIIFSDQALS